MIHIEFAGIPGSGKSFLCSSIAAVLRSKHLPLVTAPTALAEKRLVFRILNKSGTVVPHMFLHPLWTIRLLSVILHSRQKSMKGMLRSLFTITQISGMVHANKKKKVCLLLDQGSVQALYSLLYESGVSPCQSIETILPLPDILLETGGEDSVLISRLSARTRTQSRIESDGLEGIQYSRKIFEHIHRNTFYTRIPVRIHVPDERTDSDIQAIANKLAEKILNDSQ